MADITHIPIAILLEASSSRAADFGYYLIFYESPDPLIAATKEPSNKSTSNSLLFTFAPPILQIFLLLKPQSQMPRTTVSLIRQLFLSLRLSG
jgi:hypothetical protein